MTRLCMTKNQTVLGDATLKPGVMVLGRHLSCDITLNDPITSARHAEIATYFGQSYIKDLDSTNGTWVNGRRIVMHVLRNGDVIRIGSCFLRVECSDEAEGAVARPTDSIAA